MPLPAPVTTAICDGCPAIEPPWVVVAERITWSRRASTWSIRRCRRIAGPTRPAAIPIPPSRVLDPSSRTAGCTTRPWSGSPPATAGSRAGLVRRPPLPALERHPQRPDAALGRAGRGGPCCAAPAAFHATHPGPAGPARLLRAPHRRVTRTEHDGSITVLADRVDGKPLNAPGDVVVAADGAVCSPTRLRDPVRLRGPPGDDHASTGSSPARAGPSR